MVNQEKELKKLIHDSMEWIKHGYIHNEFDHEASTLNSVQAPIQEGSAENSGGQSSLVSAVDGKKLENPLEAIAEEIRTCQKCGLCETRKNTVPGVGPITAELMVIGEGPGAEEDNQGLPFVGKAGKFLDKWLEAIDMSRETNTYIANVVKCRPPGNRDPREEEIHNCEPYLVRQISTIKPKVILAVGRFAASFLYGNTVKMNAIRGQFYEYQGIPVLATYHPSAVLRNDHLKRPVWEDLKILRQKLDGN